MTDSPRVAGIYVYPIKSTAAIAATEAVVEPRGIIDDRRWLVTDAQGDFLTGREFPNLVRIRAARTAQGLRLGAPAMPDIELAIPHSKAARLPVSIWDDRCLALPAGDAADAWFAKFLGMCCRLVYMDTDCVRLLSGSRGLAADQVSFADNYPLLGISHPSLDDLNARIGEPMDMRRFRPNIVFDNCAAYAEDDWRRMLIGDVEFDGVERCSRCGFTIVDPDTAERHPAQEPLRTLGRYRRGPSGAVYFGRNLIPRSPGTVHIGDQVVILR